MKKFLALLISAVMVLSMLSTMALPAFADEDESEIDPMEWINEYIKDVDGDWYTRRAPANLGKTEEYTPAGGYGYNSEGFYTTSPDYTGMTPSYAVVSKEKIDLQSGFSMKFRIDDFSYKGEDGQADEWIAITIGDNPLLTPGNTTHGWGSGFVSLNRGAGSGESVTHEIFWSQEKDEEGKKGAFQDTSGRTTTKCELDDDGKEIYTLDVSYDGSSYDIKINGTTIGGLSTISDNLKKLNENGDFYVSIVFHSGVANGTAALTILEVNGITPTGNDEVMPDGYKVVYGDKVDASSVSFGQPALLFDSNKGTFKKDPDMQNCVVTPNGDGTYTITISGAAATFLTWSVKNELTYDAADFPYFAMLVKNLSGDNGGMYVLSGDNMSAGPGCLVNWSLWDYDEDEVTREWEDEDENYYNLVIIDLTDLTFDNEGRIHGCRIDFGGLDASGESPFDLYYMGYFRSEAEAQLYGESRMNEILGIADDTPDVVDIMQGGSMSADTYYENGTELQDGSAADWLAKNRDLENGISGVDSIGLRGWAYLDGKTAKSYGYMLMDSQLNTEIVWDDSFLQDGSDVNTSLGRTDATRYTITVDLTKLAAGEYIVIPLFQTEDGTIAMLSQWGVGGMIPIVVAGSGETESDSESESSSGDQATEPTTGDESASESTSESATSAATSAPTSTSAATTATEDDGCSSVIGAGAAALVLSAMAAAVALKKKH